MAELLGRRGNLSWPTLLPRSQECPLIEHLNVVAVLSDGPDLRRFSKIASNGMQR
jgi:hypothetical protein